MAAKIQAAVGREDGLKYPTAEEVEVAILHGEWVKSLGREKTEPGTYTRALEVLEGHRSLVHSTCFLGAMRYLRKAEMIGADVPDYIFATDDETVWFEWCDRCHVEILDEFNCERFDPETGVHSYRAVRISFE